jgi:hypothetical protein
VAGEGFVIGVLIVGELHGGKKLGTVTINVLIIGEPENRKELGTVAISVSIVRKEMGTVVIGVPIIGEPDVGNNWEQLRSVYHNRRGVRWRKRAENSCDWCIDHKGAGRLKKAGNSQSRLVYQS